MNHPLQENAPAAKELIKRWKENGKSASIHEEKARELRENQRILSESIQLLTGKKMPEISQNMRMPSVSMDLLRGTKEEIVLAYMKGVTTIMRSQDIRDGIKKATGVDMNINTFDDKMT